MQGCITTRDLVLQARTIVHEFGVKAFCRCLSAVILRRKTTFLECVARVSPPKTPGTGV
ncbi:MAG: hypothetical protein AAFX94_14620 [Myxococcota bacterium]